MAEETLYAPIVAEGLAERAARRIAEAIGLGLLEAGDRLPGEAELAERFGIAPMTLRDGLRQLREAGYIETRRGRGGGTFVKAVDPHPRLLSQRPRRDVSVAELRDVMEFRAPLEAAAAALAARRIGSDELAHLQDLVDEMSGADAYADYRRADSRLHLAVAAASGSRRVAQAIASSQSELNDIFSVSTQYDEDGLALSNGQHRAIVAAIARGDGTPRIAPC